MTDSIAKQGSVKNITARTYLRAADRLGFNIDIVSNSSSLAKLSRNGKELTVFKAFVGDDDAAAGLVARDKALCVRLLGAAGLPVPKLRVLNIEPDDTSQVFDYARAHYPVVIKPTRGSRGGGVMININTDKQLAFALRTLFRLRDYESTGQGRREILVEEYVPGKEYRVLVCCGEVVDVVAKYKGFVNGDGRNNIHTLIEATNENNKATSAGIPPIDGFRRIQLHLACQGLTLRSVPSRGQRIELDSNARWDTGGYFERVVRDTIAPENIGMFKDIAITLRLRFSGIDFIAEDLTRPWRAQRCSTIEVNTGMTLSMHVNARPGTQGLETPCRILSLFYNRM